MTKLKDTTFFEKKLLEFITEEDPLLSMLQWVSDKLIEIEVANKVGAEKGKHSTERNTYRCGTRVRRFDTRLGTIYLVIPKLRKGGYIPFFITEKKRSEQALIEVIQEAWKNGVSTRKIERLAKSLGIENISASQVSMINKGLDEMVEEFRSKKLDALYPVIWIDALYEKIRSNNKVENMAVLVVKAVSMEGKPQIIAVEPMENESEETYRDLFQGLKARGMNEVWLCVSDAQKGLQAAIKKEFLGSSWQRCKVHFMRNIMAHVNHREKESFGKQLKQIWLQPDKESAYEYAQKLMEKDEVRFPKAIECLDQGLEDSLQFYAFEEIDYRKISSTNTLERLNREIRRRSNVVGVFPSISSYLRLITTYLIEYEDDWQTGRSYIKAESLIRQLEYIRRVA